MDRIEICDSKSGKPVFLDKDGVLYKVVDGKEIIVTEEEIEEMSKDNERT